MLRESPAAIVRTQSVYSSSPDLPRKAPGWVWWHALIVIFLFALAMSSLLFIVWADSHHQSTVAGFLVARNLKLIFRVGGTLGIGSLIMACWLAMRLGALAEEKRERWFSAKVRHARERGLTRADRVAGYVVVHGAANQLLLRIAMPLSINILIRAICFAGTIAMAFVLSYHRMNIPVWIGFALFLAGIRWATLRPYMQKIAISPTAADGKPGFLFEYRKFIVLRAYSVIPFADFLSLNSRRTSFPSSLRIDIGVKGQKPRKLARVSAHRTTEGQASILVAAIEGMHLRSRRQTMIEKYGDEVIEMLR